MGIQSSLNLPVTGNEEGRRSSFNYEASLHLRSNAMDRQAGISALSNSSLGSTSSYQPSCTASTPLTEYSFDPDSSAQYLDLPWGSPTTAHPKLNRILEGTTMSVDRSKNSFWAGSLAPQNTHLVNPAGSLHNSSASRGKMSSSSRHVPPPNKARKEPSSVDDEDQKSDASLRKCSVEDCPYSTDRQWDLKRHIMTHSNWQPEGSENGEEKKSLPCDYRICPSSRNLNPFGRPDHLREHYRDVHHEDLIKKKPKNCDDQKVTADRQQWLSERQVHNSWWRCSRKCLKRVSIQRQGWMCGVCHQTCEPERIQERLSRLSRQSQFAPSSTDDQQMSPDAYDESAQTLYFDQEMVSGQSKVGSIEAGSFSGLPNQPMYTGSQFDLNGNDSFNMGPDFGNTSSFDRDMLGIENLIQLDGKTGWCSDQDFSQDEFTEKLWSTQDAPWSGLSAAGDLSMMPDFSMEIDENDQYYTSGYRQ